MDAFDADVLIYAATPGHPLGAPILHLFNGVEGGARAGVGSLILLPETLCFPAREGLPRESAALEALLARIDLRPVDEVIARLSVRFGANYRLRAADAVHLATAVNAGADRFLTNNRRDFDVGITEIDVTFPEELGSGGGS